MDNISMQKFWEEISANKTPGTMPVAEEFWQKFSTKSKLLEIGCAWGRIIFECLKRDLKVVGTDINKEEIKLLQQNLELQGISESRAQIKVDNILHSKLLDNQFDGAILLGVLGAMSKSERPKCMREVFRVVKPGGFIYIGEFELNDLDPDYKVRYDKDFKITGEYGTLSVVDEKNDELYRTHNFSKKEVSDLIADSGFHLLKLASEIFVSYHGNKKPGMMIIAQKR